MLQGPRLRLGQSNRCLTIIIITINITINITIIIMPMMREERRLRSTNLSQPLSRCTAGMLKGKLKVSHNYCGTSFC